MDTRFIKAVLVKSKAIRETIDGTFRPPSEVVPPSHEPVLPHSLFRDTRGYIEKVAFQINACYVAAAYDACAVMIRRLLEILIIETFEGRGLAAVITDSSGNFLFLRDLVAAAESEQSWSLSRNVKRALGRLKELGDLSAHSRRYNAKRQYVDEIIGDIRVVSEEFLYLAGLR